MSRRGRHLALLLGTAGLLVLAAHPAALAGSDLWGNVAPASPLGSAGLFGRYPLGHYTLDQHFDAVKASLTGGVDVSGVPPMIAYFLASVLWVLTSFLANALISLFSFAFSLDLLNGSAATGGAGALGPVARAIHSIYASVFGGPWLVLAVTVVGIWAMWTALVQRRYSETAGALGLSLIYVLCALFFVAQPAATIGSASGWTNQMSEAFLSISDHGDPSGAAKAKEDAANQLFELLVFKPWAVLEFGGLEHCALQGTGGEASDPISAPVRPLSPNPSRDAQLARRLQVGTEVSADGKVCVNNANKYARHFLSFGLGTDERNAEYDALDHGDSSKLPEADSERGGYRLGVADKPATDAMEEGGQYQRLLIAIVVFCGELGAFLLLGSLSAGIVLAQVLLLLLLAFAPVALVAAVIPGRGHAFFRGWLEKLAGYLLRKAAYSLILAVLLAVAGALAAATSAMGWLMSFGLQALFFWAVFLQRRNLAESLVGLATGPGAPGRENADRLLALYGGARVFHRTLRDRGRAATSLHRRIAGGVNSRLPGGVRGGAGERPGASRSGRSSRGLGGSAPRGMDSPEPSGRRKPPAAAKDPGRAATSFRRAARAEGRERRAPSDPADRQAPKSDDWEEEEASRDRSRRASPPRSASGESSAAHRDEAAGDSEASLISELREERERGQARSAQRQDQEPVRPTAGPELPASPPRWSKRGKPSGGGR